MQMRHCLVAALVATAPVAGPLSGQAHQHGDSGYAAMQHRGAVAMGVDQYTSRHQFEPLPDGGRIELQREQEDSAGTATIRAHLQHIATAFAAGDFSLPGFVHATDSVPGVWEMATLAGSIKYVFHPLPRGGEVRMTTANPEAVDAIHRFLRFQAREHRTGQRE